MRSSDCFTSHEATSSINWHHSSKSWERSFRVPTTTFYTPITLLFLIILIKPFVFLLIVCLLLTLGDGTSLFLGSCDLSEVLMLHSWNIVEHIQKIPKGGPRFFFVSFTADMHRCVAVLFFETFEAFARIARARGPKSLASASAAATRLSFFISLISFVRAWPSLLAPESGYIDLLCGFIGKSWDICSKWSCRKLEDLYACANYLSNPKHMQVPELRKL